MELHTEDRLVYQFYPIQTNSLNFKIKAPNDAHIALTTVPHESRPMYEVFFGGWGNTKSVIRKDQADPDVVEAETSRILDPNNFRAIWIRWDNNTISAGLEDDFIPILEHYDSALFPINYFGICTGWGARGHWIIEASSSPQHTSSARNLLIPPLFVRYSAQSRQLGAAGYYCPRLPSIRAHGYPVNPAQDYVLGAPPSAPIGFNAPTNAPRWLPASGGSVPPNAVVGGEECNGEPLYVARAHHEGALIPGKLNRSYGLAYIACGGRENEKHDYEVLCDCSPRWLPVVADGEIPPNALVGGRSEDGDTLYIGRAFQDGSIAVGKVQSSDGVCHISFGGNEFTHEQYEILLA